MTVKADKNILLVAVNSRFIHSNPALFILKRVLERDFPESVQLLELTIKDKPEDILQQIIQRQHSATHVLFSVYIWNSELISKTVPLLKQLQPHIQIIMGGPEITYNIQKWEKLTGPDFLISGPGEQVISSVVNGTVEKRIVSGKGTTIDSSPFPYTEEDLELLRGRMLYYESSRGCPYKCSYCQSACSDQPLQFRNLETVKEELKILSQSSVRMVKFVDRSFNCKPERARELWEFILELDTNCSFHFEIHPLFLQEEDIEILKKAPADLFHLEVGIQSTSDKILKAVNRNSFWSKIKDRVEQLINSTEIPVHVDQIVGLPGADYDTVTESFNQILSLGAEEFQMGFLKALPGTPLHNELGYEMKTLPYPPYEVLETPSLKFHEMRFFHRIEDLMNTYYNSGLFSETLSLVLFSEKALYPRNPFLFFKELLSLFDSNKRIKGHQWAALCKKMILYCSITKPEILSFLHDALRKDWAPLSQGQYAPPPIAYPGSVRIKEIRSELWGNFKDMGITKSQYNSSYLIILEEPTEEEDYILSVPLNNERQTFKWKSKP